MHCARAADLVFDDALLLDAALVGEGPHHAGLAPLLRTRGRIGWGGWEDKGFAIASKRASAMGSQVPINAEIEKGMARAQIRGQNRMKSCTRDTYHCVFVQASGDDSNS